MGELSSRRSEGSGPAADVLRPVVGSPHPLARAEIDAVPVQERKAIYSALDKLAALGP
jgi:hypothetical protein